MDPTGHELYFAHQRTVQTVHAVVIRYRLALIGPRVDVAHSDLDATLPPHSTRVRAGGAELLVDSAEWVGRRGDLGEHVLGWLIEHVDLGAARPRPGARRYDQEWMGAWRGANPRLR